MNGTIKNNLKKYFAHTCLYNATLILISGSIVQAFMLESGISEAKVSSFIGLMQAVQAISMISMAGVLEHSNVLKVNRWLNFGLYPMLLAMLVFCFAGGNISPDIKYPVLIVCGAAAFFCIANLGILEYKVPYDIFDMRDYGRVSSVNGIMVGTGNMAVTAALSYFLKRGAYFTVMSRFLLAGCVFLAFGAFFTFLYKKVDVNFRVREEDSADKGSGKKDCAGNSGNTACGKAKDGKISLLRYRPFYLLALPNFFRGFAYGTTTLFATIGYHYGIIDSVSASYMVLISNVFVILGCALYAKLTTLKKDGLITLLSTVCIAVTLPLSLAGRNTVVFLSMYGASLFVRTLMDYSIPVSIVDFVDYRVMGRYSSWRMALFMVGTSISGFLCMPMVNLFGGMVTLVINGLLFLCVGIAYFLVCRMNDRGEL